MFKVSKFVKTSRESDSREELCFSLSIYDSKPKWKQVVRLRRTPATDRPVAKKASHLIVLKIVMFRLLHVVL